MALLPAAPRGPLDQQSRFAELAQALSQTDAPAEGRGAKSLRRFSTKEVCADLLKIAPTHLRRLLKADPSLPQGHAETEGAIRWFTLQEVGRLRAHLAQSGARHKAYLPPRAQGAVPPIVTFTQGRSGSGKTCAALHMAQAAVLEGYRVLMIDLDPAAGLSARLLPPAPAPRATAFALFARHYTKFLHGENAQRLDRGEAPIAVEGGLSAALETGLGDLIQASHWPGLDLVPADLSLARLEMVMPHWRLQARRWRAWEALSHSLREDPALGTYDLVFLDTGAGLGQILPAALVAGDLLVLTSMIDAEGLAQSRLFLQLLAQGFETLEAEINLAARALGRPQMQFQWQDLAVLMCRVDPHRPAGDARAQAAFLAALGQNVLGHALEETGFVTPSQTLYEAHARPSDREAYGQMRARYDAAWRELRARILQGGGA